MDFISNCHDEDFPVKPSWEVNRTLSYNLNVKIGQKDWNAIYKLQIYMTVDRNSNYAHSVKFYMYNSTLNIEDISWIGKYFGEIIWKWYEGIKHSLKRKKEISKTKRWGRIEL